MKFPWKGSSRFGDSCIWKVLCIKSARACGSFFGFYLAFAKWFSGDFRILLTFTILTKNTWDIPIPVSLLLPEKATFWHLIRINWYINVGSAAFSGRRGWPTFETMTSLKSHTSINSNSKKWIWIHTLAAGSNTIRDITSHVFDVLQSRVKFFLHALFNKNQNLTYIRYIYTVLDIFIFLQSRALLFWN